jgi:V/A-type H+-transporting ATPase subunit K
MLNYERVFNMSEIPSIIAALGPGLAEGLAAVGTTLGIMAAISSGIPVISEDPASRGKIFILAFMPMTQTLVYGLSYMFLSYAIIMPGLMSKYGGIIPPHVAGAILAVSVLVGLAELFSAWKQGQVCALTAAHLIKTRGGIFGTGMILALYQEFIGVLGMVFGFVMLFIIAGW